MEVREVVRLNDIVKREDPAPGDLRTIPLAFQTIQKVFFGY